MASRPNDELKRRALSLVHYVLLVGGAAVLLADGLSRALWPTLAALMAGWVAGSFAEYAVHRFVLHGPPYAARVHARHHASPAQEQIDALSYFGPIVVAIGGWLAIDLISGHAALAHGVTAGLCLQYSWFRALHRRMHRPGHRLAAGRHALFHRGHHGNKGRNFGVTTPVWDRMFGTSTEAAHAAGKR